MQVAYNPASLLQLASQLVASAGLESALIAEHPVVGYPDASASRVERHAIPQTDTPHSSFVPNPATGHSQTQVSALNANSAQRVSGRHAEGRSSPMLFGPAVPTSSFDTTAPTRVPLSSTGTNGPVLAQQSPSVAPVKPSSMLNMKLATGSAFPVATDLPSARRIGIDSPTMTLTQQGVIVVEVTTTIEPSTSVVDRVSAELSSSYIPQAFVLSSSSFERTASSMFAYTPPPPPAPLSFPLASPSPLIDSTISRIASPGAWSTASSEDSAYSKSPDPATTHQHKKHTSTVSAGIERKSSSPHHEDKPIPYRLSDGYVVLISIAVLFVCGVLLYFYANRRKQKRGRATGTSGRSILSSSNSGPPSMGEDEDKYFTAGTRPGARTLPPDSGTSVNYQDKAAEDKPGQKVTSTSLFPPGKHGAGVTEHDSTANQALNVNYYGYRTYGMTETASSNTNERTAFATARSDIYDCVSNGKRHNFAQSASRQEAAEAYPVTPASRIAARRGAISFDHVKIQPLPSIPAHSKAGIDARTGYAGYECPRTEASVLSQHMLAPSPAEIDTKRALLDTTSANPGIKQTAGESDSLGIRIKPRKLTRDSVKRSNASSQGKGSRQLVDTKSQLAVARNPYQQATPENSQSIQDQPRLPGQVASKFNRQPLASPPHTPNLAEPSRQRREAANFLSLVDSVESLSESYQFAVRHKPPLGPLHVVEPHAPALPDELRVKRGDELFVVGEFADGWVLAVNVSRANECGMIPRRCLFFPTTPFMTQKSVMETITPPDVQSPAFSP